MRKKMRIFSALIILLIFSSSAFAQSPQISSGLTWLYSAQTPTGNWPEVVTTDYYSTAASLDSISVLDPSNPAYSTGFQWLSTQLVSPTDYISRQIIALSRAGQDTSGYVSSLLLYRNSDGSFGGAEGCPNSYNLDTVLALQALKAVNYYDSSLIGQSLNYITSIQNTDGGWSLISGAGSNVYLTSQALKTLSLYNSVFINQASIDKAVAYLLSKQNPDGGFGSSPSTVYDTALAFDALVASGANISAIAPSAINYLTTTQLVDGSWDDDPYSTALALRALASARPNLVIGTSDISFSNPMPQENESVTITATIHNTGFDSASGIVVRFFLGDPSAGGTQISTDQVIPFIALGSSAQASVSTSFSATGGKTIFVVVDPNNLISETSKLDNKASARLWVATAPDLAVYSDDLKPSTYVPAPNTAFTLAYTVRNLGETATEGFDVAVYDGDPNTGGGQGGQGSALPLQPLQTAHISGINGNDIRIGTLYLVVDSDNQAGELSETNNI